MKYKILKLDNNGRISFTKEELEKLLDEVYEEGRRDSNYYWYKPYWTCENDYVKVNYNNVTTNTSSTGGPTEVLLGKF